MEKEGSKYMYTVAGRNIGVTVHNLQMYIERVFGHCVICYINEILTMFLNASLRISSTFNYNCQSSYVGLTTWRFSLL